jgi:hypothetical protein
LPISRLKPYANPKDKPDVIELPISRLKPNANPHDNIRDLAGLLERKFFKNDDYAASF